MKLKQLLSFLTRIRQIFTMSISNMQEPGDDLVGNLHSVDEEEEEVEHLALVKLGYTLGEKLGEGSFSAVVSAFSERHGRNVAIKIITKKNVPKLYTEKFLPRELDMIKNFHHINVIRFLNVTESRKIIYVIMDLAANGNLLEIIKKNSYIDENIARYWFHDLVNGIAYCHGQGVAHRDLKCENLLLDDQNILKITDFSFARANLPHYLIDDRENVDRSVVMSSTFCGSYAYACPEILLRKPYEPHLSDTWSMGVILYAMLYGRLPFDDTNLRMLLQDVRRPVRFLQFPVVSYDVRNLILKILSPSRIRIYIPKIRSHSWYIGKHNSKTDESIRLSTLSIHSSKYQTHSTDMVIDGERPSTSSYIRHKITRHRHKTKASRRKKKSSNKNDASVDAITKR